MTIRFSDSDPDKTWDGLAVAPDDPRGTTIVVRRPAGEAFEYLLLHRASRGIDYEGEWAWTAPAGARQPGEAVLPSALRELAEEAGITGAELVPVDLSGRWAVFQADVPAPTRVELVDPEHDRYEWVSLDAAHGRVLPAYVAEGNFGAAASRPPRRITFRPLAYADLPALVSWRSQPHVLEWFRTPVADVAEAEKRFGSRIDGTDFVSMHVFELDGRPSGYLQHYRVRDDPDYREAIADDEAVAIDYLVGDVAQTGGGLGPQLIWRYLLEVVRPAHPSAPCIVASPDPANARSIRALEKTGFTTTGRLLDLEDGPEQLCTFDVARLLGT